MAEERLIDDDKDRKFKIIKNEDGEEELVLNENSEEQEETPVLDIYEYEDDEDLTAEQLAEKERLRQAKEEAERVKFYECIQKAQSFLDEGDFESALYNLNQADEFAEDTGEYHCLKLKILTRNFTDFTSLEKCEKASKGVKKFATAEQKAELFENSAPFKAKLKEVEDKTNKLYKENEQKKAERRSTFKELYKKAARNLTFAGVPFLIFTALLITFASMIFALENGAFLILTIVFGALNFIALIFTLIALRRFLEARRRVKLNERDTASKLGREYLSSKQELEQIKQILSSFENDLS